MNWFAPLPSSSPQNNAWIEQILSSFIILQCRFWGRWYFIFYQLSQLVVIEVVKTDASPLPSLTCMVLIISVCNIRFALEIWNLLKAYCHLPPSVCRQHQNSHPIALKCAENSQNQTDLSHRNRKVWLDFVHLLGKMLHHVRRNLVQLYKYK